MKESFLLPFIILSGPIYKPIARLHYNKNRDVAD